MKAELPKELEELLETNQIRFECSADGRYVVGEGTLQDLLETAAGLIPLQAVINFKQKGPLQIDPGCLNLLTATGRIDISYRPPKNHTGGCPGGNCGEKQ